MSTTFIEVAVPLPVTGTFTYSVPDDLAGRVEVGMRVLVPFGRRKVTGFVVGAGVTADVEGVKDVVGVLDVAPVVDPPMIELTRWIADYYLASWGEVLRATLPPGINMESRRFLRATDAGREALAGAGEAGGSASGNAGAAGGSAGEATSGLTDRRLKILELACVRDKVGVGHALREAGVSRGNRSDVDALVREGLVEEFEEVHPPKAEGGREQVVRLTVREGTALEEALQLGSKAPRQAEALRALAEAPGATLPVTALAGAGVASATLTALVKKGLAERAERPNPRLSVGHEGWGLTDEGELTAEQRKALDLIGGKISAREFAVVLLHGVTGSGKTRVYSEAIQVALDSGRGAIVLVPEISLTPQMVQRMKKEFGDKVAVVHSGLSLTERYDTWRAIREGLFPIVVGPRSAVFSPVRDLGVIVVDEEHEQTYKQSESPRYHARDVAAMRARLEERRRRAGDGHPQSGELPQRARGQVRPRRAAGAHHRGAASRGRGRRHVRGADGRLGGRVLGRAPRRRHRDARRRQAGHPVPEPARVRLVRPVPVVRALREVPELQRLADVPLDRPHDALPLLRHLDAGARKSVRPATA